MSKGARREAFHHVEGPFGCGASCGAHGERMRCLNGREEASVAAEGGFGRAWMGVGHPRDDGSAIRGKLSGAATRRRVLDDGDFEGGSGRGGRLQNAAVRARFRGATVKGAISYYVKLVSCATLLVTDFCDGYSSSAGK